MSRMEHHEEDNEQVFTRSARACCTYARDVEKDQAWLASLRRDFEVFATTAKTKPDQKPATQAQRAALVRDLINSGESL